MVLLISDKNDKHADIVCKKMNNKKIKYFRLNLDVESLKKTYIKYTEESLDIYVDDKNLKISEISCVWARRMFVELLFEELEYSYTDIDFKIWKDEWNKTLLGIYLELKQCKWLNELNRAYRGENKYLQRKLAKEIGFKVPNQIISNIKSELINFYNNNPSGVVLKLMSQEFYKTEEGYKGLYVNKLKIDDLIEFSDKEENPIVLQEYIKKKYEVRYTYVNKRHFICKIESQKSEKTKVDWRRYDITNTPHYEIDAPIKVKDNVEKLMEKLQLEYGAFDFIVTEDEEWYFLEVNTMGQWLWIETLTGMKISDEIVNYLEKNSI